MRTNARRRTTLSLILLGLTLGCGGGLETSTDDHPLSERDYNWWLSSRYHLNPDRTFSSWPVAQLVFNNNGLQRCTGFMIGPRILATSASCAPVAQVFAVFSARLETRGPLDAASVGDVAFEARAPCRELMTHHLIPRDPNTRFSGHDRRHNSDMKLFYCQDLEHRGAPPGLVFGYLDFDLRELRFRETSFQIADANWFSHGFEMLDGHPDSPLGASHMFSLMLNDAFRSYTYLSFPWAQGGRPQQSIELGGFRPGSDRWRLGFNSWTFAGAPFFDGVGRVKSFWARRLHEPNSISDSSATIRDQDRATVYHYQTAFELLTSGQLTPSGRQTDADTLYTLIGGFVATDFGLNIADYTRELDRRSLHDPTSPNQVFDLQEAIEERGLETRRPSFVFDMGSRRQAAQWRLQQPSASNPGDVVRFDFNDALMNHSVGPVRGLLRQDSPANIDQTNPSAIPIIATRENLDLDPTKTYRVAVEAEYLSMGYWGATEIEVDLGAEPVRFSFQRTTVQSALLQPGSPARIRLKAWGDAIRIRSVALFEQNAVFGFDTQEERLLWRDNQGRHAVFLPKVSAQPDWALDIRPKTSAYTDGLGLLSNHPYRLCFDAALPSGVQGELRIEDPIASVVLSSLPVLSSGRHCHEFTSGPTNRVHFAADGGGELGAQVDRLVLQDILGRSVPIDRVDVSGFISRPAIAPYYRCQDPSEPGGSEVALSGLIPGATVEIEGEIEGQAFADAFAVDDASASRELPGAFARPTDYVNARQSLNGVVWSMWTQGGPPELAPQTMRPQAFVAPFYECGRAAGVGHFTPGSTVSLTVGDRQFRWISSGAYSEAVFGSYSNPFQLTEQVRGHARFCGREFSEAMPAAVIEHPPEPLERPVVEPTYVNQRWVKVDGLRQGAVVELIDAATGHALFSVVTAFPTRWFRLRTPARPSMRLYAVQSFPGCLPETDPPPIPPDPVLPCERLPAPRVAYPFPNAEVIHILESVPGATIIVVDGANLVIGHQPGPMVQLARPLRAGETILVTQALDGCQSEEAIAIAVGASEG